jgi:hypothetical protein
MISFSMPNVVLLIVVATLKQASWMLYMSEIPIFIKNLLIKLDSDREQGMKDKSG